MENDDIEVFLASRFEEFSDLRRCLVEKFAATPKRYRIVDFNSSFVGDRPVIENCLKAARGSDVFLLLVGETYPAAPAGPGGLSVSHGEYLEALKVVPPKRIFVFLKHEPFHKDRAETQVKPEKLAQLLATIRENQDRESHMTLLLQAGDAELDAKWIVDQVDSTLSNVDFLAERSRMADKADDWLERALGQGEAHDNVEAPRARVRIQAANQQAQALLAARFVPKNPFERNLYRRDDSGNRRIRDFQSRLDAAGPGEVFGIVSSSGQGKSTYIANFPTKNRLSDNLLILTGRELDRHALPILFADVALISKLLTRRNADCASVENRFYLLVDALNECTSTDSLLLELIVYLERIVAAAKRGNFPLVIVLTMRPDIAKTVPELSRKLVTAANTYDFEPFGESEYNQAARRHRLLTPYDALRPTMRMTLQSPLMLGIVGRTFENRAVPLDDDGIELLGQYLERLASKSRLDAPDLSVLDAVQRFAGRLLELRQQTLDRNDRRGVISDAELDQLVLAGILTDSPEGLSTRISTGPAGFKYDMVAEYCIGRCVESQLAQVARQPVGDVHSRTLIQQLSGTCAGDLLRDRARIAELHWTGLAIGLVLFFENERSDTPHLLIELMQSTDPLWRMLGRVVLQRLYLASRNQRQSAFSEIAKALVAYSNDNKSNREFRAELMRTAFETLRSDGEAIQHDRLHRNDTLGLFTQLLCAGLKSRDQEIAEQSITALSSLMSRPELVPIIERNLRDEIERMNLKVIPMIFRQIEARVALRLKGLVRSKDRYRSVVVPLFSVLKFLALCFASELDPAGERACLNLLSTFLKRLGKTGIGRAVGGTVARHITLFVLSSLLDIVLRSNRMPINLEEWQQLVDDPRQFETFKTIMRLIHPSVRRIDPDAILVALKVPNPNPFIYQTLLTALSTKHQMALSEGGEPATATQVIDLLDEIRKADSGNGTCKYVVSLVLYHINAFGDHGDQRTANMMVELSKDILLNHDGYLGSLGKRYNSNVIGTTGRSLLHLNDRNVPLELGAFSFIQDQVNKVKGDRNGAFTEYLLENLALLAIMVPANEALLKVIKEDIYFEAHGSTNGPPIEALETWMVDAFVRIRAVHPVAVDSYLIRRSEMAPLYKRVREAHARATVESGVHGLDGELVSWAFERIVFDIVTRARPYAALVNKMWCEGLDRSPRLKPSSLVELGLICLDEGINWAEAYEARGQSHGVAQSGKNPEMVGESDR